MIKDINNLIGLEEMPQYDLFISQVLEYLNDWFPEENYTQNIIQNYIKSEVISRPLSGKKRGYTKHHIIQLILVSYLRPVLSGDEIKKVFALAFNEINKPEDDIITWEDAYGIFIEIVKDKDLPQTLDYERSVIEKHIKKLKVNMEVRQSIEKFIAALIISTRASILKRRVTTLIS